MVDLSVDLVYINQSERRTVSIINERRMHICLPI